MTTIYDFMSEEQYYCSICLDVFTSPVSLSCGHNFCMSCIECYWGSSDLCQCPLCMQVFKNRPELRVNTFIAEMTENFKTMGIMCLAGPGEVTCDICTRRKVKAMKSCLVCLTSYCETHLEPHKRVVTLKGHKLIDPVNDLEDRMCRKHERPLELFCRKDQTCICMLCSLMDHNGHNTLPGEKEWKERKFELEKTEAEVQQMIQNRKNKVILIKESIQLSKTNTDKEIENTVHVFTDLVFSIKKSQADLIEVLEEKQRAMEKRAEGVVEELEREIAELEKKNVELEQLSNTDDHIHFLQSFPSLSTLPHTKDWSEVMVHTDMCVGSKLEAYNLLGETINKAIDEQLETEFQRIQKYAVEVTLDPNTSHPALIVSEDGKQVSDGTTELCVPNNPERFDSCLCVLGTKGFACGRHYWEVFVGGKTNWDIGVVRGSINRKGELIAFPENGFWTIWLRNGKELSANCSPPVVLELTEKPLKVGIYVDYEEGQVSFYDVSKKCCICTFTNYTFTEKLYPIFSPCLNTSPENTGPLIITPIIKI